MIEHTLVDPLSVMIALRPEPSPRPPAPARYLLKPCSDGDDYIMEMDYSTIATFLVCPRKSENVAVSHREAQRESSAQNFGTLFHKLEEKRMLVGWTPELDKLHAELIADHFVKYPPPVDDHRTSSMMHQVLTGYKTRYKNDGLDKRVVQLDDMPFVERPFKIPLMTLPIDRYVPYQKGLLCETVGEWKSRNGLYIRNIHVIYVGKIDTVFTDEQKLYWVRDIKTSSRGGQDFAEAFRLSLQTRGYCWAAQKILGKPVVGLMLDAVIVRPPTRTGKGTEYNRMFYFYTQDSLSEWEDDMKAHITSFVGHLIRGFFPQTSLSFKSPCPSCDFFSNCSLPRHQRAADLASETLYRDVTWNPMLIE